MRVAITTDESYPIHTECQAWLEAHGYEILNFGALARQQDVLWVEAAAEASRSIVSGDCDFGVFFCWTGTGIAMAANKVSGIRAALCTDAETARGARIWNDANVLALSNRLTSPEVMREMLEAWCDTPQDPRGREGVNALLGLEHS